MKFISVSALAKVNLFLEVTGKRSDGYHELATLFAKISLADRIDLQVQAADTEDLRLHITGPLAPQLSAEKDNLILRAVRTFEEEFSVILRAQIHLNKYIPMGAGLGGGSSDAGAVLRALCTLFGKDPLQLLPRAAKLGADVPLFLYPDIFLKGEGIGEKLTPVSAPGQLPWAVLVYPDTAVSTKGVFGRITLPTKESILTNLSNLDKLIRYINNGTPWQCWRDLLFNRLEEGVLPHVGPVRDVKNAFCTLGASPLMSGSGSTVFALTSNRECAEDLASRIKQQGRKVFIVHFGGTQDENN